MAGRHNLEIIRIMDEKAVITEHGGPYAGQDRYECLRNVIRDLEAQGCLVGTEPYTLGMVMEVITQIRNIRGEMNVAPSLKLKVTLAAPGATLPSTLERGRLDHESG